MHYNNLTDARETANIFKSGPIICKLADLGEAQSKLLQTRVISNNSRTHFVRRGSPAYMAPEILVEESILKISRSWAIASHRYAVTCHDFFHHLESWPENPFQYERACDSALNVSDGLLYFLRKKIMPSFSQKYEEIQASCCRKLRYAFFNYLEFNASERATINEVMENFAEDSRACLIAQRQ